MLQVTDFTDLFKDVFPPDEDLNAWVCERNYFGVIHWHWCITNLHSSSISWAMQNVSGVVTLQGAFSFSTFNGAIDQWDVSNVVTLESTFEVSSFNGDISNWVCVSLLCSHPCVHLSAHCPMMSTQEISRVESLRRTFLNSTFDGSIDQWDTSSVRTLESTFAGSSFKGDVSDWVREIQKSKDSSMSVCVAKHFALLVVHPWRMSAVSEDVGTSTSLVACMLDTSHVHLDSTKPFRGQQYGQHVSLCILSRYFQHKN